jgi:hypothetical protein
VNSILQDPATLEKIVAFFTVSVSVVGVATVIASAIKSGALTRIRFGSFEIEAKALEKAQREELVDHLTGLSENKFEAKYLANYYEQALSQSKFSFWFSLVFASIGFVVIITAIFFHESGDWSGTALKVSAGAIVDAVAGLFFVQSAKAQQSMQSFFEKLRIDRLHAESQKILETIQDDARKDQLKAQLVLKYAEIDKLLNDRATND